MTVYSTSIHNHPVRYLNFSWLCPRIQVEESPHLGVSTQSWHSPQRTGSNKNPILRTSAFRALNLFQFCFNQKKKRILDWCMWFHKSIQGRKQFSIFLIPVCYTVVFFHIDWCPWTPAPSCQSLSVFPLGPYLPWKHLLNWSLFFIDLFPPKTSLGSENQYTVCSTILSGLEWQDNSR